MPTTNSLSDVAEHQHLHCMEVWGGNGASDNHFSRPGLDLWIFSQSPGCAAAGGSDLHLLSSCASGRITRMLLADVCGYGPLFAEIADGLRELMKQNVNSINQARLVRKMNHRLETASRRGGFASTLISTYFAATRSLTLCNAGHPPPLLFRAAQQAWSVLKQDPADPPTCAAPLGVVDVHEYQEFKTTLGVGDMVLGYSNTFAECRRPSGAFLGVEGFLDRVRQLDPQRPSDLTTRLVHEIKDEHPDNLAAADATMLLCRATETGVHWRDNVLAPFRLLRAVSDNTRLTST